MPFKRVRFALQKDSFCNLKGALLKAKRTPFFKALNLIINNNDNAYEKKLLSIGTFIVICYSSKL